MRVSLRWLSDYVPVRIPPRDLAHRLTMAGVEVGGIEETASWDRVVVGQVVRIDNHPNADRLILATVDLGGREQTVVTGAPNLAVGQKVPFAAVGARLFSPKTGTHEELRPAKLRGVVSEGMVCSEIELGLGDDHGGILVLPEDAPVGRPLSEYLGDAILELEPTPNRRDCLSMIGVAHEVAALTGATVTDPPRDYPTSDVDAADRIAVEIADPDLCGRYVAAYLDDVTVGPSPDWLQKRLLAAGMRPINNIVDITNYVMLESGQPLHAFDYDRIRGRRIIVRRARAGEVMRTLDGIDRALTPDYLMIADAEGSIGIAGVMGGENTEVSAGTRRVLLEAANFNHISIRRTSRHLRLRSEASSRFDKGLSPELIDRAVHRAVRLMAELSGGRPARTVVDNYPRPRVRPAIPVGRDDIRRVLGVDWDLGRIRATLEGLTFTCAADPADPDRLIVTPPYHRLDVNITEDVVEEVARIVGYDEVPAAMLQGEIPVGRPTPERDLADRLRDRLAGAGMQEVINYTLVSRDLLERVGHQPAVAALRVTNPLTVDQEYLRTTLRGSLLQNLAANQRWAPESLRLFEIGPAFFPRAGDLPEERAQLAGLIAGRRGEMTWHGQPARVDFFDAKGVVELILRGERVTDPVFEPADDELFHPGKVARVLAGDRVIGVLGEVHPHVLDRFDIDPRPVVLFEIDLAALLAVRGDQPPFDQLPRFPAVVQDLALVVDRSVPAEALRRAIAEAPLVAAVRLFDVYEGDPLPPGRRSLAFSLAFQAPDRTLTDAEVQAVQRDLVADLGARFGATLRG